MILLALGIGMPVNAKQITFTKKGVIHYCMSGQDTLIVQTALKNTILCLLLRTKVIRLVLSVIHSMTVWQNNIHWLLLSLRKGGFRGTFAINGSKINSDGGLTTDTTRMSWEQVKDLSDRGHEISNHGWKH